MTDVKALLDAATPLPWTHSGPGPEPDGDQMWLTGDGHQHRMIAWTDASEHAAVDLKLAALAVNRLPDYEAAVDALERLYPVADEAMASLLQPGLGPKPNVVEATEASRQARAVLRRLRP